MKRRDFVNLVGAGGALGFFETLSAMGLVKLPHAEPWTPLPQDSGQGMRVAVLGAGVAGLVAALELRRAGFQCTVLEALSRPGGRNWTLRGGDRIEETASVQSVSWDRDPELYFNAGPARLNQDHVTVLRYCRELGVPLEVFVNDNRSTLIQADGVFAGAPQSAGRVVADARGWIAEMAARQATKPELREFLRHFGDLDETLRYKGSTRAGFATPRGIHPEQQGSPHPPLSLEEILKVTTWHDAVSFQETRGMTPTMFQPVGGMDAIPRAFARVLGPMIRYQAEVVSIRRSGAGARVSWRDRNRDQIQVLDADFVVCTIPLPPLSRIDTDFPAEVRRAIRVGAAAYVPAVKVAFEANRWWETDLGIYGGITWTSRDIGQIWYPSSGFNRRKGILLGAYIWNTRLGNRFGAMRPERRIAAARDGVDQLHPGYGRQVDRGISVAWSKLPYAGGGWVDRGNEAWSNAYPVMRRPVGPVYFAGEHMSMLNQWQEGAMRSAQEVVTAIAGEAARPR